MFTGLVQSLAEVVSIEPEGPGVRLTVRDAALADGSTLGDSICVNGCCLTVVAIDSDAIAFQAGTETLSRTNLGELQAGSRVNLEPSLKAGDQLGGHYVTGHVDCLGTVDSRDEDGEWAKFFFRVPAAQIKQMASKGSVAVDGVSLTLVDVEDLPDGGGRFSVALIPHTLGITTLGSRQVGDRVNIETDVLAKYVERQLGDR
ncbi:MAG: riboflavin synthase [Planctomycetota bacterium]